MFISRGVRKILSYAPRKSDELRDACNALAAEVDAQLQTQMQNVDDGQDADEARFNLDDTNEEGILLLFRPFVLACQSKVPKLVETALDCMQKLILNGYVRGVVRSNLYEEAPNPKPKNHIDVIVGVICGCFDSCLDDVVQLQIIKALLAAVSSTKNPVHDAALISAVRTCYNIHLVSRNLDNQKVAKVALTQIVNTVLKRADTEAQKAPPPHGHAHPQHQTPQHQTQQHQQQQQQQQQHPTTATTTPPTATTAATTAQNGPTTQPTNTNIASNITALRSVVIPDDPDDNENERDIRRRSSRWEATFVPGKFSVFVDTTDQEHVTVRGTVTLAGQTLEAFESQKQEKFRTLLATASNMDIQNINISHVEAAEGMHGVVVKFAVETSGAEQASDVEIKLLEAVSDEVSAFTPANESHDAHSDSVRGGLVFQRDAFLLFRALCRISLRPIDPAAESPSQNLEAKSKVLSLDLLLTLLKNAGQTLLTYDRVVQGVRGNLITSLLRNVTIQRPGIFSLSVEIFAILATRFRHVLKTEIQVFFQNIFLRTLDSPHSSFEHKACIMRAIKGLAAQPQLLVDLFLNYDCEMESVDLFERLVTTVCRAATFQHSTESGITPTQDAQLRHIALDVTVEILASLQNWVDRTPEDIANAADEHASTATSTTTTTTTTATPAIATPTTADASAKESDSVDKTNATQPSAAADSADGNSSDHGANNHANGNGNGNSHEDDDASKEGGVVKGLHMSKEKKLERARVIEKFNLGAKEAIDLMVEYQLAERTPGSIAAFLKNTPKLDPSAVGAYLGVNKEFNIAVMHRFIELFNFVGMEFDRAIRHFFENFQLPGEAQVVDRVMEKFGSVYCTQNPDKFRSSDTAFVLAFSLLMLNTDLHSHSIKNHMTKQQFISNNRGINKTEEGEDCDLDPEYLSLLYDSIAAEEIKVLRETPTRAPTGELVNPKQRQLLFAQETDLVVKRLEETLKQNQRRKQRHVDTFVTGVEVDHARMMFAICWCPALATFSLLLERSTHPQTISLTLKGFKHAIHVASHFYLDTERNAFVLSLSKFTCLHTLKEMTPKNIEAIKTLLAIAQVDGDFLQDSWYEVIHTISQLQKLHQIGSGGCSDAAMFDSPKMQGQQRAPAPDEMGTIELASRRQKPTVQKTTSVGMGMMSLFSSRPAQELQREEEKAVEEHNAVSVGAHFSDSTLDQVFSASDNLSNDAVVHFVTALCKVARQELDSPVPRIFCLQKIVETSYFNMDRGRLVWRKIWEAEGILFTHAACHKNQRVAMYCIDSLRQLATKFLEKAELENYQFQKDFLKPFVFIMSQSNDVDIRELVLNCMENLILSRGRNIKSGWRCVLNVCASSARVAVPRIVHTAFNIVSIVFTKYFDLINNFFVDGVHCLVAFGGSQANQDISVAATELVRKCAQELAQDASKGSSAALAEDARDQAQIKAWFPILTGLSRIISSDPRLTVRNVASDVLFDMLHEHGHMFSANFWVLTFRGVLFPIFDDIRYAVDMPDKDKDSWLQTTCLSALRALVSVLCTHFEKLSFMLPDILTLLTSCIMQVSESLSKIGFICLHDLISKTGQHFTNEMWVLVLQNYRDLSELNTPFRVTIQPIPITFPQQPTTTTATTVDATQIGQNGSQTAESVATNGNTGPHPSPATAASGVVRPSHRRQLSIEHVTPTMKAVLGAGESNNGSTTPNSTAANGASTAPQSADSTNNVALEADAAATPAEDNNNNNARRGEGHSFNNGMGAPNSPVEQRRRQKGDGEVRVNAAGSLEGEFDCVRCKCFVQLELVKSIGDTCTQFHHSLPQHIVTALLDLLHGSYVYASSFNKDIAFRVALQRAGLLKSMPSQLPSLLKQEVIALSTYIRLCRDIALQPNQTNEHPLEDVMSRLLVVSMHVVDAYAIKEAHVGSIPMTDRDIVRTEQYRELVAWNEIVVDVIGVFDSLSDNRLEKHLGNLLPGLFALIGCESVEVREALRDFLVKRCEHARAVLTVKAN